MLEQQEVEFSGQDRLSIFDECTITIDKNSIHLHRAVLRGAMGTKDDIYPLSGIRSVHVRANPDMWRYRIGLLVAAIPFIFYINAIIPDLSHRSGGDFLFHFVFFIILHPFAYFVYVGIGLVFLLNTFAVEIGISTGRKSLIVFCSYLPFKRQKEAAYARAKQVADVIASRLQ